MFKGTLSSKLKPFGFCRIIPPTKFAEDLLLFVPSGEEDFGVEALGLETFPRWCLGAGSVSRFHLDFQVYLEQVGVFLLDVTGVQVVPDSETGRNDTLANNKKKDKQIQTYTHYYNRSMCMNPGTYLANLTLVAFLGTKPVWNWI